VKPLAIHPPSRDGLDVGEPPPRFLLRRSSRIWLSIFLVLILSYTVIVPNFDQPSIEYAFAAVAIFLFGAQLGVESWTALVAAALGLSILHAFVNRSGPHLLTELIGLYLGILGRGGLAVLGWSAIWNDTERSHERYTAWLASVGILLFVFASILALNLTIWANLRVLDYYLYLFDGSLGFQPSFLLGRICLRYGMLGEGARFVYCALPLPIAIVCAGHLKSRSPWRPLLILGSAGLLGYLLYFLFPAAGPLYAVGSAFPDLPHPFSTLREMHPHRITLAVPAPRNAMPSLHLAWAMLLWFNSRSFSKISRGLVLIYVVLTAMATLATGEHYLADLVVAVPFSIAVQALWTPARMRYLVLGWTAALTFIWLVLLRYGTDVFLVSPAIPWACSIASTVVSLWLYRVLERSAAADN
jgi:hypothetical protein